MDFPDFSCFVRRATSASMQSIRLRLPRKTGYCCEGWRIVASVGVGIGESSQSCIGAASLLVYWPPQCSDLCLKGNGAPRERSAV